jgi:hypothetical protein
MPSFRRRRWPLFVLAALLPLAGLGLAAYNVIGAELARGHRARANSQSEVAELKAEIESLRAELRAQRKSSP